MDINELQNQPLYGVNVGIIYYFYEDPNKIKQVIQNIFKEYCELANSNFTFYRHNKDLGLNKLKVSAIDYFSNILNETDFTQTQHLLFTDASKENLQSSKVEVMLRTIKDEYLCKTPNWIYFEISPEVPYSEILDFIKQSFYCHTYHYACCNYVLSQNDHLVPKSVSEAIKLLKQTNTINDCYSILTNPYFLKGLENGIDGANFVQVLSKKIYDIIGFNSIMDMSGKDHIYHEFGEDYVILMLSDERLPNTDDEFLYGYKRLHKLLKPIIADVKRPQMYWKPDEWDKWRNRLE